MNPTVTPSADTAWTVQKRVVFALMLRETKTLFGRHKLGYLWEIINAILHVSIFWVIRSVANFQPPNGMSTAVFLIGGFVPFFVFMHGVLNSMNAIWANRSLLVYPQVYPLDLIVARILLKTAMQVLVFMIMIIIAWGMGQHIGIVNPHSVFIGFALMMTFALGLGSLLSAFNLMWPTTGRIVPIFMRVLFFTSGLFFSVANLPMQLREIIYYNPLAHVVELVRNGFVDGYAENFISLSYAATFAFIVLVAGLLLERYSRRYLDRMV